jgi:hypothetical protein
MKRTHLISLLALIVAIPAATAGSFFASTTKNAKPCFIAGNAGYQLSGSATADYTVRIDNSALAPSLRMQIVNNPDAADFVLIDDSDEAETCGAHTAVSSIRLDPQAAKPDLTIALSQADAQYKIYVQSANYTEQDAAALFAVIWQSTRKTASAGRMIADGH